MSHLKLSRQTGINRTKVYRIADTLIARGLITSEQDDTGKRLAANSPDNLEIALTSAEEKLKNQRQALNETLPQLQELFSEAGQVQPSDFMVNTYEGVDGFKQMLWNELKTKGEIVIFGYGSIQDLIGSQAWAEKHREKTVEAGYKIRELLNPRTKKTNFTKNTDFITKTYVKRYIDPAILPLGQQVAVYNNTVAIYNWQDGRKVGLEIINPAFAAMQRASFEHFWKLAK
jgi:sugar-specific transcriptional regulator TrmB